MQRNAKIMLVSCKKLPILDLMHRGDVVPGDSENSKQLP